MSWEIDLNDGGASKALNKAYDKLANPVPLYDEIGQALAEEVRLGFNDASDPYGQAWAHPVFRSGQPLRDTGRLMNSITHAADSTGIEVGTNVCYAATHQFGALISATPGQGGENACGAKKGAPFLVFQGANGPIFAKQVNVPARPFLPTQEGGMPAHWLNLIASRVSAWTGFGS